MEPTDFEKWCAEDMGCSVKFIMKHRYRSEYCTSSINARYRAWNAGVRSRLPYQTPPKGDEDGMD